MKITNPAVVKQIQADRAADDARVAAKRAQHQAQDVEGQRLREGSVIWFPEMRPQRQKVVGIPEDKMVLLVPADGSEPDEFAHLPMYAWRGRRVKY